jgi:lipoprotein-anchoring transpeptidase ErfK/SrfK
VRRFLFILVLCLAFAAPAMADTPPTPDAVVPDGVVLGNVPIGGLTADAATAAIVEQFSRPVTLRIAGTKVSVSPAALGIEIYADSGVAAALAAQPDTILGLRAGVDRARVKAYVAKLAQRLNREPSSSRLLLRNFRPLVTPSLPGIRIQQGPTAAMLTDELAHGTRAPIRVPAKILAPTATPATIGPVIVIKRSSNLLTLYRGARYVRQFHVATGQAAYPTPLGHFEIVVKYENPWWYPPPDPWARGEKPTPPGPGNPLGTRWMGLSSPGVGIHGTPDSASVGYSLSHGCIRMYISDAEWLFDHVGVGTQVFIVSA